VEHKEAGNYFRPKTLLILYDLLLTMEFTLAEAKEYAKKNNSREWVGAILRHTNNESFAKRAETKGILLGPVLKPIDKMINNCGPDPGMKFPEKEELYKKRVAHIIKDMKKGWDMPPLIVWYLNHEYSLADGSHRFAALKQTGYTKY